MQALQSHASGGLPFHFSEWRLRLCALNSKALAVTQALWRATYANGAEGYEGPHAPFPTDRAFAFIDSINYRYTVRSRCRSSNFLAEHCNTRALLAIFVLFRKDESQWPCTPTDKTASSLWATRVELMFRLPSDSVGEGRDRIQRTLGHHIDVSTRTRPEGAH